MLAHAAGHDAAIMLQIGIDIERHAVQRDPMADAHADRGDLAFAAAAFIDPDADTTRATLAFDIKPGEGADKPFLEVMNIGSDVAAPRLQVQHHISDALAWPVIGELAAAPGTMNREETGLDQIRVARARSRRVKRRVLQEPDELGCGSSADGVDACRHHVLCLGVGHEAVADAPLEFRHAPIRPDAPAGRLP